MSTTILFGLFAATLFAVARFHQRALAIALGGLVAVVCARLALTEFSLPTHLLHEWQPVVNLAGLLLGFAVLADCFERSHLPPRLTKVLPAGRLGAFCLLALVALLSAVLDNIAAAMIGGSAAITLFQRKVHIGYLAAIVAASNAGGAASVIGDTTTTMMWIEGVQQAWVVEAAIGAVVALAFFGWFASAQQHRLQPMVGRNAVTLSPLDLGKLSLVGLILAGAIAANFGLDFPAVGVWVAILLGVCWRAPKWRAVAAAMPGMAFLVSLVLTASMMPVESLPPPSACTTFGLGIVSAFFDNIPLTKLALQQDHYDWGLLAFCVGYGGSMLWFGSSAGVAIAGLFPEARSAKAWLLNGWHVAVGYGLGFLAMLLIVGWHAQALPIMPR